jgi:hypothetical protein
MSLPNMNLSDLSDGQLHRIRNEGCKPVVDIEGNAIGVARNKRGAALVTSVMVGEAVPESDVYEFRDRYVIGEPHEHAP